MGSLFRYGMLDALSLFFPAEVTIQAATLTRDTFGEPMAVWADVDDLDALKGQLAPASEDKVRRFGLSLETTTHIVALRGHYAAILPVHRAVVDDVVYEITGVRHGSQGVQTYLGLKRVVASA